MKYEIIETHIKYRGEQLAEVAVMWKSNDSGYVRASYITDTQISGYGYIGMFENLSEALLQKTAGYGIPLPDKLKRKYFPGKHKWE